MVGMLNNFNGVSARTYLYEYIRMCIRVAMGLDRGRVGSVGATPILQLHLPLGGWCRCTWVSTATMITWDCYITLDWILYRQFVVESEWAGVAIGRRNKCE